MCLYNAIVIVGHLAIHVPFVDDTSLVCILLQTFIHELFFLAGVGRTAPDPSASVTLDGVQVPLGKGSNTNIDDTSLLYNEYPLIPKTWFMNLILILLSNYAIFFVLSCIISYNLIAYRKVKSQRLSQYTLF